MYLGQPITPSPISGVVVLPSAIASLTTFVSGEGIASATAGVAATFVVFFRDIYGNAVPDGASQIDFSWSSGAVALTATSNANQASGSSGYSYTLLTSGSYKLSITIKSLNAHILGSPFTLFVQPSISNLAATAAYFDLQSLSRVELFTQVALSFTSRDIYGNRRFVGGDSVEATVTTSLASLTTTIQDNSDGSYVIQFKPVASVSHKLTVMFNKALLLTRSFDVAVGAPYAGTTSARGAGLTGAQAGEIASLAIDARDISWSPSLKGDTIFTLFFFNTTVSNSSCTFSTTYNCWYSHTASGLYQMYIMVLQQDVGMAHIIASPFAVTITSAAVDQIQANISSFSTAGINTTFSLFTSDRFGNKVIFDEFSQTQLLLSTSVSYLRVGTTSKAVYLTNNKDGSFSGWFMPYISGQAKLYIDRFDINAASNYPIQSSPFSLDISPGTLVPKNLLAEFGNVTNGVRTDIAMEVGEIHGAILSYQPSKWMLQCDTFRWMRLWGQSELRKKER